MGIKVEGKRGDRARRRGVDTSDAPPEAPKRGSTDFTAFNRGRTVGNSKPAPVARPARTAAASPASSPAPKPRPAAAPKTSSGTRANALTPKPKPRPAAAASSPAPKPKPAGGGSKPGSTRAEFNTAFAAARKAGKKEFTWNGKSYNTKLA